jgi:hypothetical protein
MQVSSFGGFTLRFPGTWHAVKPTFLTATLFAPIGWVTTEDPGPQCTPDSGTGHIRCHAPIARLDDGGVLVSLTKSGGPQIGEFHANSTFAGLPAQLTRTDGSHCGVTAVAGVDLVAKGPASVLRLTACFGAHSADAQAQVRDMLANATYTDR